MPTSMSVQVVGWTCEEASCSPNVDEESAVSYF